jgi:hypothetical protein
VRLAYTPQPTATHKENQREGTSGMNGKDRSIQLGTTAVEPSFVFRDTPPFFSEQKTAFFHHPAFSKGFIWKLLPEKKN